MAGEHILKLLDEPGARISIGNKWLIRWFNKKVFEVFEAKPYQQPRSLIQTEDEELACKVLKGE